MRKGRAASNAEGGGAGREANDAPGSSQPFDSSDPLDPFDPSEPFEAHDLADRRRKSVSAAAGSGSANAEPSSSGTGETTYTRSRRTPADSSSSDQTPGRSKKPARSLKARAIDYLSRREYSRVELSRKLTPFLDEANDEGALEALLDSLEREGWLSDSRFAENLVNRRAARMGASRIVGELKRHSVGDALIEEVGAQLRETEFSRAQAVWSKKFGQLPETPAERAKQARFLAMRGFSSATIAKILKGGDDWEGV
ncbi:recombination regulator RecX [Trinickia terrae]